MRDPRLQKLADVLVNYSTGVKKDDLVRLAGPIVGRPLVVELYRAVLAAGGHPYATIAPDECAELRLEVGSEDQLRFERPDPAVRNRDDRRLDQHVGLGQHQVTVAKRSGQAGAGQPVAEEVPGDLHEAGR